MIVNEAKIQIMAALDSYEDAHLTRISLSDLVERVLVLLHESAYSLGKVGEEDDDYVEFSLDMDLDDLRGDAYDDPLSEPDDDTE